MVTRTNRKAAVGEPVKSIADFLSNNAANAGDDEGARGRHQEIDISDTPEPTDEVGDVIKVAKKRGRKPKCATTPTSAGMMPGSPAPAGAPDGADGHDAAAPVNAAEGQETIPTNANPTNPTNATVKVKARVKQAVRAPATAVLAPPAATATLADLEAACVPASGQGAIAADGSAGSMSSSIAKRMKIYAASFQDGQPLAVGLAVADAGQCCPQGLGATTIAPDDEQVILQLKVHDRTSGTAVSAGIQCVAGDDASAAAVPNAYNATCFSDACALSPAGGAHHHQPMMHSAASCTNLHDYLPPAPSTAVGGMGTHLDDGSEYATAFADDSAMHGGHDASAMFSTPMQCQQNTVTSSKVVRILMDFEEKSKVGEWPSSTSVHCYWCCHKFNNTPFGLPVKYAQGRYHVCGCFCSLECAAAWNFSCKDSIDEIYEKYSLLNMLSDDLGHSRVVKPAPDRTCLAMFGGHMSIDEFRSHSTSNKLIIVNYPPMMSLTQQVEEINETELRSEYKFIPIDNERVHKYQEKIKLKRSKPLVNFKNTLDSTMNLRYH